MCDGLTVIGVHCGSGRYIKIVVQVGRLENFRPQLMYRPAILKLAYAHYAASESRHAPLSQCEVVEMCEAFPYWQRLWQPQFSRAVVRVAAELPGGRLRLEADLAAATPASSGTRGWVVPASLLPSIHRQVGFTFVVVSNDGVTVVEGPDQTP
jgi:hypothetical protein